MQDKRPYNEKEQRHGLWEVYRDDGTLAYRENYVNGESYGYRVIYYKDMKNKHINQYHAR